MAFEERRVADALIDYTQDEKFQITANRWFKEGPEPLLDEDVDSLTVQEFMTETRQIDQDKVLEKLSEHHNRIIQLLDQLSDCVPTETVSDFLETLRRTEQAHIRRIMTGVEMFEDA